MKSILMTAGEASADRHAACVIRQLKATLPEVEVFGMGGPAMVQAGLKCRYGMEHLSVMGFSDVLPRLSDILGVWRGLRRIIREERPDVFIPVDLPDFNMPLARYARRYGVKVLYYIAPQAWAWRRYRARTLARITDGLAVIFPFEEPFFASYGVKARYVGHPILEDDPDPWEVAWPPRRITLLPGSRAHEIERMLPVMLTAKRIVQRRRPGLAWTLPVAPGLDGSWLAGLIDDDVTLSAAMVPADLALVTSGTATLEMAVRGVPQVICYRTSQANYRLARAFVRLEHIGMPNVILGREAVPELIQERCTGEGLAGAMLRLLEEREEAERQFAAYAQLRKNLGNRKAAQGVATWIRQML